tara:strand:- start:318 stop:653 length:336 start_codon:yes stop_codon:yes gene_type:complete
MTQDMTEKEFQGLIFELGRMLGWHHMAHFRPGKSKGGRWSTPMSGDVGFPDLVMVRDRVIFVELKSEVGKLGPGQQDWLDSVEAAGVESYLWRPSDLANGTVAGVLNRRQK